MVSSMRRVHAEGQAVAGGIDSSSAPGLQVLAPVAQHVQHRPEHLALARRRCGRSRSVSAARRCRARLRRQTQLMHRMARRAHGLDVVEQALLRLRRDDRTDVGRQPVGIADRSSAIAPFSIASTRSAISSCRHSTRSAEQRWPAESNAEASTSAPPARAARRNSTIIAFWPPVSAISGIGGRRRRRGAGRAAVGSSARPRSSR